jgi:hypothetical protein
MLELWKEAVMAYTELLIQTFTWTEENQKPHVRVVNLRAEIRIWDLLEYELGLLTTTPWRPVLSGWIRIISVNKYFFRFFVKSINL